MLDKKLLPETWIICQKGKQKCNFPNIRMLFSMSIEFSKFWNRDQQESSLIFYIKNHNSTKFFSIYILVSKATLKTAWLPYQYWKSHLDLLQFHKALVAAFPPVLKISYKLASFTYKIHEKVKRIICENGCHLSSWCRSTPTEGGAETVASTVGPKTATTFNSISSDTLTCLHMRTE